MTIVSPSDSTDMVLCTSIDVANQSVDLNQPRLSNLREERRKAQNRKVFTLMIIDSPCVPLSFPYLCLVFFMELPVSRP